MFNKILLNVCYCILYKCKFQPKRYTRPLDQFNRQFLSSHKIKHSIHAYIFKFNFRRARPWLERDLISLSYQTFLIARSRSEPRVLALFCGTCALKADEASFGHFELPQVAIHHSIVVLNFKFGN